MEDIGWPADLPDNSSSIKWSDAAAQIKSHHRHVLQQDFDSDINNFQAYLHRVAQLDAFPHPLVQPWEKEELCDEMEAYVELIDAYPLNLEVFQDKNGVYRRSMVRFCYELLQAKAALVSGLVEKAWWHLARVSFHEGQAQGYYLASKPSENKRQSGKKGGIAKEADKQKAARDACIEHLKNDRPQDGWMSTEAAIAAVAPKVKQLIEKQREDVDVHKLLYNWLNGDKKIQQAGGFTMQCIKK